MVGSFQHQIGSCVRDGETLAPWGRLLLGPHDINDTSLLSLRQCRRCQTAAGLR